MVSARTLLPLLVAALAASACKPKLEGRASVIDSDRVLAVRSEPAEQKPDGTTPVTYTALYAGPDGDVDPSALDWAFCTARKPLAVTGPVALTCLAPRSPDLTPIRSRGLALADAGADAGAPTDPSRSGAVAPLVADDCAVFGPSPPTPKLGQPPARPADPDTTGGYYQPVRVMYSIDGDDQYAVGSTRLDCGIPAAAPDVAIQYKKQYRPNENPALSALVLEHASGADETFTAAPMHVAPGERVTLRAEWAKCTTNGCTGSEPYSTLDPVTFGLVDRREAIFVSWFSTGGDFEHDRTGRTEDDGKADLTTSENGWTAPDAHGAVSVWVVIRDDRGGVGWSEVHIDVEP